MQRRVGLQNNILLHYFSLCHHLHLWNFICSEIVAEIILEESQKFQKLYATESQQKKIFLGEKNKGKGWAQEWANQGHPEHSIQHKFRFRYIRKRFSLQNARLKWRIHTLFSCRLYTTHISEMSIKSIGRCVRGTFIYSIWNTQQYRTSSGSSSYSSFYWRPFKHLSSLEMGNETVGADLI